MSAADFTVADEIRAGIATIAALFEEGMLDKANLAEGLGFIATKCSEIDGRPAVPTVLRLPVMTLADVVAEAQRPRLHLVQGGRP